MIQSHRLNSNGFLFLSLLMACSEEKTVEFKLKIIEDLRHYDATKQSYVVELGKFEIQIGSSSKDIRLKKIISVEN